MSWKATCAAAPATITSSRRLTLAPRPWGRASRRLEWSERRHPREETAMSKTGIGAAVRRKEDQRFVTGKGQYTADVNRPGQTHACFLRSPHARARLRKIEHAVAEK